MMIFPNEDQITEEKNRIQEIILREAKGDLKEYSKIIHREFEELKKKYKGKFEKSFSPARSS